METEELTSLIETELTSLIETELTSLMDVADYDLMPPLLPDVEDSTSLTSLSFSRKLNEACQANLNRTGRKQGELNKERNVVNPNKCREACPGSMNNLQRKGRVQGSKNKEKLPKPPGFNPNQKRDEANRMKKQEKKEAKEKRMKLQKRSFRRQVRQEVTEQVPKVHSPVHQRNFSRLTICII